LAGEFLFTSSPPGSSGGNKPFAVRFIKLGLISVVVFFLIFTVFSLFIPSRVRISKAINMDADKDSVFSLIRNRENWNKWHPAFMPQDSGYHPPLINFVTRVQNDSQIIMDLSEGTNRAVTNGWMIHRYPGIDSFTLQWYMDFHLQWYPWKKFGSLLYEGTYGNMMQKGLENLKNLNGQ
jgi:hypothetical protein